MPTTRGQARRPGYYIATYGAALPTAVGVDGTTPVSGSFSLTYYAASNVSGTRLSGAPTNAGVYTVVAAFTSTDSSYSNGTPAQATFTISAASTTIAASNAAAPFRESPQSLTLTADVSSATRVVNEGTVTFTLLQSSTVVGTATTSNTVHNGIARVSYALPTDAAAGDYTLDAVYNPGADFAASSDSTHRVAIAPATAAIQFTAVTLVPNLFAFNQTETIAVHVSGSGGVVNRGRDTFSVDGHSVSAAVDGNGDATASLTLPLLTATFPRSITASFSGQNRLPTNPTQTAVWGPMDVLLPSIDTFAATDAQSVQSYLFGLPLLDFLYSSSGRLTEVVFRPDWLSWDFSYFGPVTVVTLDGVLPVAVLTQPQ